MIENSSQAVQRVARQTPPPLPEVALLQGRLAQLARDVETTMAIQKLMIAEMIAISGRLDAEVARTCNGPVEAVAATAEHPSSRQDIFAPIEPLAEIAPVAIEDLVAGNLVDSEQLTLIAGLDAEAAALLNSVGINRFADIAALTPEDVKELSRMLGSRRRIAQQGWIEQAAILAAGGRTHYVAQRLVAATETTADAPNVIADVAEAVVQEPAVQSPAVADVIQLADRISSAERDRRTARRRIAAAAVALAAAASLIALDLRGSGWRDAASSAAQVPATLVASIW